MNELQYPQETGNEALRVFMERYRSLKSPSVLELGTKKWGSASTHHKDMLVGYGSFTMCDVEDGEDVDIVADAHDLAEVGKYDVIFAASVWEHLEKPWIAADELLYALNPGGIFLVQTHQSFPIHGYPKDYFRFSREALASIFANATEIVTSYDFAAILTPQDESVVWNPDAPVWLNSNITGRKNAYA